MQKRILRAIISFSIRTRFWKYFDDFFVHIICMSGGGEQILPDYALSTIYNGGGVGSIFDDKWSRGIQSIQICKRRRMCY